VRGVMLLRSMAFLNRLLDRLNSEVGVAAVHGLEKSDLGVTSEVHILSTVCN